MHDVGLANSRAGKAERLTIDHKPSLPEEKSRIDRAGGFVGQSRVNGEDMCVCLPWRDSLTLYCKGPGHTA